MFYDLPNLPEKLLSWRWEQIEPYYLDLERRQLNEASAVAWLTDWSRLEARAEEAYQRVWIATTIDTSDAQANRHYQDFLDTVYPHIQSASQRLKQKLIASGVRIAGFEVALRNLRADVEIFHEANLPLLAQQFKLQAEYERITGDQTVVWDGREVTLAQLEPAARSQDRQQREQVWRTSMQRWLQDRPAIDTLWVQLSELRHRTARNIGLPDYCAYRWRQLKRFDYTPQDCQRFHEAIEQVVVPAVELLNEKRRQALGVDRLRPWDIDVDSREQPPLRPFRNGDELRRGVGVIFRRIHPLFEDYLEVLHQEGLLDLDHRKGKAPGGYCVELPACNRPFLFMNAVGIHHDIHVFIPRCGDAFRILETTHLPYLHQRQVGLEVSELACTSLELLALQFMADPEAGFYTPEQAGQALIEFLDDALRFWPYMAVVDAFQLWAYTHPEQASAPANCDACWGELWDRFMTGVDWSGLEEQKRTGWQRKQHIHIDPLYYVEYGLAQLGAFQIWRNARRNHAQAVAAYRQALALGSTRPLSEVYAAAQIKFAFDRDTLAEAVELGLTAIEELAKLAG
jgi:oligoendopeptidase F